MKVAEAVAVLNHDRESCNRVAANQWLVQFQQTHAAWEVATSILTSDHLHFDLHFFAAQILKRKVTRDSLSLSLSVSVSSHSTTLSSSSSSIKLYSSYVIIRQIQNESYYLQLGAKDALLNALLLAAKRFTSGPPQVICLLF